MGSCAGGVRVTVPYELAMGSCAGGVRVTVPYEPCNGLIYRRGSGYGSI